MLWKPSQGLIISSNMYRFMGFINSRYEEDFAEYAPLYQWSVENISEFYIFFNTAFWVLMTLAIVVAGCMYYFSAPMLTFILGEPYAGSVAIFRILLLSVVIMYPGYLFTNALIALDLQQQFMSVVLAATLLNIALNFALIPPYGAKGAAWSTVCSDMVMTTTCAYILFRHYRRTSCVSD